MRATRAGTAFYFPKSLLGMTKFQKGQHLKRYEKEIITYFECMTCVCTSLLR